VSPARTLRITRTALAALLLGPILALAGPSGAALATPGGPILRPVVHRSCAVPRAPRTVHCLSLWRHGGTRQPGARAAAAPAVDLPASGYGPPDILSAYQLDTSTGAGQTIAIVDAFDNPQAESDLAAYRAAFGLPACTTTNGCFRKVNQDGGTEPPAVYDTYGPGADNGSIVVGGTRVLPRCSPGTIGSRRNAADLNSARYVYDRGGGLADVVEGGSNGFPAAAINFATACREGHVRRPDRGVGTPFAHEGPR
jgi:hypothetical protein